MTAAERTYLDGLIREEQGRLLGFIRQRVKDRDDAEDILQEVLYQLTAGFDDLRSVGSVSSWLFTVARNKITDHFRKKRPERFSGSRLSGDGEEGPLMLEEILPALTHSPEDEYMREVIWEAIEAGLDDLPEAQREVFILHEFEDVPFATIAEVTGEGINTLLSRKRYAVLALRERLRDLYEQLKNQ
ncbi:MAG: RNA polymerase sigma factor [Bacteroidales bacterium]